MKEIILFCDEDRQEAIGLLKDLDLKRPHTMILKVFRRQRSISQNRLYWMWMACLEDETGQPRDAFHQYFSEKYLPGDLVTIKASQIYVRRSTTALDTRQFTTYLDKIAAEVTAPVEEGGFGIRLVFPGDPGWDSFWEQYR